MSSYSLSDDVQNQTPKEQHQLVVQRLKRRKTQVGDKKKIEELGPQLEMNKMLKNFIVSTKAQLMEDIQQGVIAQRREEKEKTLSIIKANLLNSYSVNLEKHYFNVDDPMYKLKQEKATDKNIKKIQEALRDDVM